MDVFGTTRSRMHRSHALLTPESFVRSDLPGWERSQGVVLISPRIGSRFVQYLALMEPGGRAGAPPARPSGENRFATASKRHRLTLIFPRGGDTRCSS